MQALDVGEVLYEFIQCGNVVKVSAIDPVTRIEVAAICPSYMTRTSMKLHAARKLRYVIRKRREAGMLPTVPRKPKL